MTWTKLSDDYSDDCWTLSDAAFRLHTEGLIWSNRKLLNLRLAKDEIRRWATCSNGDIMVTLNELVDCGWWVDDGDAYVIVHHGAYQRTSEQVLKQQERSRINGKAGGRPTGVPREQAARLRRTDS
jgi:hypothetical protein